MRHVYFRHCKNIEVTSHCIQYSSLIAVSDRRPPPPRTSFLTPPPRRPPHVDDADYRCVTTVHAHSVTLGDACCEYGRRVGRSSRGTGQPHRVAPQRGLSESDCQDAVTAAGYHVLLCVCECVSPKQHQHTPADSRRPLHPLLCAWCSKISSC